MTSKLQSEAEGLTTPASKAAQHIPVLRLGKTYESLEQSPVVHHHNGAILAHVSQVAAGMIRRDLRKIEESSAALRAISSERLLEICAGAAHEFTKSTLPINDDGDMQSPEEYVRVLSATSGLPESLCRRNMEKIRTVLVEMPQILRGLTRGLDLGILDRLVGEQAGIGVSYYPTTDSLGVVLPSNSPTVNSIWLPAIALKTPVVLKPGAQEPWTPLRLIRAFIAAGCPAEAFGFYPTDHEGAATVLETCGRALVFGDESTTRHYAGNPAIQVHGPGRSKVIIGRDCIEQWKDYVDVLVESVVYNGGRSCINASAIIVPAHAEEIAAAVAAKIVEIRPADPKDASAQLAAFANPKMVDFIEATVEEGLSRGGATDVTSVLRAGHGDGARRIDNESGSYLLPTIVRCDTIDHPLGNTEFLFPFASVIEMDESRVVEEIGPTLVVTAITRDEMLIDRLLRSPHIDRLNLGPVPTCHVEWDQPHEGNLFEFLYRRRSIQRKDGW